VRLPIWGRRSTCLRSAGRSDMSNKGMYGLPQGQGGKSGSSTLTFATNLEASISTGTTSVLNTILYVPSVNRLYLFDNSTTCRVINPDTNAIVANITMAGAISNSAAFAVGGDCIIAIQSSGTAYQIITPSTNATSSVTISGAGMFTVCFDESAQRFVVADGSNSAIRYLSNTGANLGISVAGVPSATLALYVPSTSRVWTLQGTSIQISNSSTAVVVSSISLPIFADNMFYDPIADRVVVVSNAVATNTWVVINPATYAYTSYTIADIFPHPSGSYIPALKRSIILNGRASNAVAYVMSPTLDAVESAFLLDRGFQFFNSNRYASLFATDNNGKLWVSTGKPTGGVFQNIAKFSPLRLAYIKL
jgi:hypothetical protein